MRVIASPRSRASALLAPLTRLNGWASLSGRCRGNSNGGSGRGGFRLLAVELLFKIANAGLKLLVVLLKDTLAFFGPLVQGFPIASLSPGLKLHGQTRANRARPLRDSRGGTRDGGQSSGRRKSDRRRGRRTRRGTCSILGLDPFQFGQGDAHGAEVECRSCVLFGHDRSCSSPCLFGQSRNGFSETLLFFESPGHLATKGAGLHRRLVLGFWDQPNLPWQAHL